MAKSGATRYKVWVETAELWTPLNTKGIRLTKSEAAAVVADIRNGTSELFPGVQKTAKVKVLPEEKRLDLYTGEELPPKLSGLSGLYSTFRRQKFGRAMRGEFGALEPGEIDQGRRLIEQGLTELDSLDWIIGPNRKRVQRPTSKDFQWTYASYYRPLMHLVARGVIPDGMEFEIGGVEGKHWSLVYTKEPLPIDAILRLELSPLYNAMGRFIYDYANAQNRPVELGRVLPNGTTQAIVLFKNPRGLWQISTFEEGVGPIGHDEQADNPWEMVREAWINGFRRWVPGAVDSIMETVPST